MATKGYNVYKRTCDKCGVVESEAAIIETGRKWPNEYTKTFYHGPTGNVLCPLCIIKMVSEIDFDRGLDSHSWA